MNILKLKELVLKNRSLAENNPLNLLKNDEARKLYNLIGENNFIKLVNKILDENE